MAKDKKSFVLYSDLIHTVKQLPNDKAGELFKHILSYVNDENPNTDDILINIAFEPIKQSLKRDLERYEKVVKRNYENGKKGGRPKKTEKPSGFNGLKEEPKKADSVSDSVSGNVNDKNNIYTKVDKPSVFPFKESLIEIGVSQEIASDFMKVRSKKKASNTQTSFNRIKSQIEKSVLSANECIKISVERDWKGFEASWIKDNNKTNTNGSTTRKETRTEEADRKLLEDFAKL